MLTIQDKPRQNDQMAVISIPSDHAQWTEIKKKYPNIKIVHSEGFMLTILQQSINFKHYLLDKKLR